MNKGRILAIDYGQKSIGLAVSDEGRQMAFGRGVLKNVSGEIGLQQVLLKIVNMCRLEGITMILIGLPMGVNNQETVQTERIRLFAKELADSLVLAELNWPIEFIDESFSSFEANGILTKIGVKGKDKKKTEDEMAAIILIHRYIDFKP